jgi:hypothetical protein
VACGDGIGSEAIEPITLYTINPDATDKNTDYLEINAKVTASSKSCCELCRLLLELARDFHNLHDQHHMHCSVWQAQRTKQTCLNAYQAMHVACMFLMLHGAPC